MRKPTEPATPGELAMLLRCSPKAVQRKCAAGIIPTLPQAKPKPGKRQGRRYLIPPEIVNQLTKVSA